jgi:hypothetical protein
MSPQRRTALLVLAALLGIALAAAITWGTSQLVRQRIGLASEPLTAGRRLLPPLAVKPAQTTRIGTGTTTSTSARPRSHAPSTTTFSPPPTTTVTVTPPPSPAPTATAPPVESTPPVVRGSGDGRGGGDSSARRDD